MVRKGCHCSYLAPKGLTDRTLRSLDTEGGGNHWKLPGPAILGRLLKSNSLRNQFPEKTPEFRAQSWTPGLVFSRVTQLTRSWDEVLGTTGTNTEQGPGFVLGEEWCMLVLDW